VWSGSQPGKTAKDAFLRLSELLSFRLVLEIASANVETGGAALLALSR
jgi:hypothetical protein